MQRPRVITHNVVSVDGRLAVSPRTLLMLDERWPEGGDGYLDILRRHQPQVLLEGSGSLVTDDQRPEPLPPAELPPHVLGTDYLPAEVRAKASAGWFVVPDSRGRVRWTYKEFPGDDMAGWHLLVLVAVATPLRYLAYLRREQIPYLVVGRRHVDLTAALKVLRARFAVDTVVATGGARLGGALLRAGLIDEIETEIVPIAVGGTRTPMMFTAPDLDRTTRPTRMRCLGVEARPHGRVLVRYAVEREPTPEPKRSGHKLATADHPRSQS
ncbi:dihydrofolate reductase family protein [Nocardia goodfellowii]|uniref:Riboflavin biosynthesis pyrimidine reductase n=1 Tax=Nocardia goodfellowii TaxID=882446 RepID=A0ABS4QIZ1_9NOCA|nr:dihydrofolate reductase family protein [Nocardia goodfellowii]MBP2191019.1 riboflavin biosynthesis pyrimidine reductase [Nocardia goodfellowii]